MHECHQHSAADEGQERTSVCLSALASKKVEVLPAESRKESLAAGVICARGHYRLVRVRRQRRVSPSCRRRCVRITSRPSRPTQCFTPPAAQLCENPPQRKTPP